MTIQQHLGPNTSASLDELLAQTYDTDSDSLTPIGPAPTVDEPPPPPTEPFVTTETLEAAPPKND